MKFTDIFERTSITPKRGDREPRRYRTGFKWRATGGRMVVASGATQEEADEACWEKIRARFRGTFTPRSVHFRGTTILIWRDGDTWVSGFMRDNQPDPVGISYFSDLTTREDVERAARRHLAEIGWDGLEETSEVLVHPEDQVWFGKWARKEKVSRVKYRQLLARGWTPEEAHTILCGFPADAVRMQELGDPWLLLREIEAAMRHASPSSGEQVS